MIRIILVDDHPLFREGVLRSLEEAGDFEIVGQGGSAADAIRLVQDHRPDMALVDISMPGSGIVAAQKICAHAPDLKVVMLTVSESGDDIMAALKAGAHGYVLKGVGSVELAEILRGIMAGESYVSPSLAARLWVELRERPEVSGPGDLLSALTIREDEILRLVAKGMSNKHVAIDLDIQEKTVKHHMTSILNKLKVRNRTEAALLLRDAAPRT
ncbi:response regulator [Devosia sp. SL43]|uniref:response regulator n=1 Tax=Devosia sp. SL43 TaxID=2806348 RepID=UPI001F1E3153|nr:response regulator transcription factor [Devosia sp. SL43]UJW86312.1 response regulator transcription factor [Devosia sp. SL43]